MLRSMIYRLHFETEKDMNDVIILHALCIEKTLCTTSSVSERGDMECGDPEPLITLCEINSIKSDNIDGYIVKNYFWILNKTANWFDRYTNSIFITKDFTVSNQVNHFKENIWALN